VISTVSFGTPADAAHLGSSDRYMAAIEKFMGEAEARYQLTSDNVPGSNA
jgi:hypothetical protein